MAVADELGRRAGAWQVEVLIGKRQLFDPEELVDTVPVRHLVGHGEGTIAVNDDAVVVQRAGEHCDVLAGGAIDGVVTRETLDAVVGVAAG